MYKCEICFENRKTGPVTINIGTRETEHAINYAIVCLPCICKVIGLISDLQITALAAKESDRKDPVKIESVRG